MKHLLSTLAICLLFVTAQAQSLYFSADAGNQLDYIESSYIGVNFDTSSEVDYHVFLGVSQNFSKGEYIGVGAGIKYMLPDPLSLFGTSIPFGIQPVTMGNIRGVFGEHETHPWVSIGSDSEATLAYNVFLGLNYKAISAGVSVDQYLSDKRIFFNPLSVRLTF